MYGAGKAVGPISVVDGAAVIAPTETATFPIGFYATEWRIGTGDDVNRVRGEPVRVEPSLFADSHTETGDTEDSATEQLLAAAEASLLSAAKSGDLSVSTGETSISFETRADLHSFVAKLRQQVAVERLAASQRAARA